MIACPSSPVGPSPCGAQAASIVAAKAVRTIFRVKLALGTRSRKRIVPSASAV